MRLRVAEMASYFGIQGWFHKDVSELSGGQKQLLNLASIMAMQPEVLILDEPTSQLDPIAASDFLNTVRKINQELGTTIILSEHRLEEVFAAADRVIVMDRGRVIADGAPRETGKTLYESDNDMLAALPAPMRIYYGVCGEGRENASTCPLTVREGRTWLSHDFGAASAKPSDDASADALLGAPFDPDVVDPVLEMKDVWFRYARELPDVLRGVSIAVPQGQLFAVVGGNGTGKSTMLRAACGVARPYRGPV